MKINKNKNKNKTLKLLKTTIPLRLDLPNNDFLSNYVARGLRSSLIFRSGNKNVKNKNKNNIRKK